MTMPPPIGLGNRQQPTTATVQSVSRLLSTVELWNADVVPPLGGDREPDHHPP
jgi:hypothetical protein